MVCEKGRDDRRESYGGGEGTSGTVARGEGMVGPVDHSTTQIVPNHRVAGDEGDMRRTGIIIKEYDGGREKTRQRGRNGGTSGPPRLSP